MLVAPGLLEYRQATIKQRERVAWTFENGECLGQCAVRIGKLPVFGRQRDFKDANTLLQEGLARIYAAGIPDHSATPFVD